MDLLGLYFFSVLCLLSCPWSCAEKEISDDKGYFNDAENLFQHYMSKFKKSYIRGSAEYDLRFQNFVVSCVQS